ncbi:putative glycerophosphoryl diester phosphodiesterase precursor (plasmid) [Deinococcus aetherius]|uniref:Glycerophosphoryl diester phosphodiesterase n=1 Tax=Deinococcus aetherius TaxID=200252 RepID=A0ABN6RP25_9DEIO|nr:glycerophosphodiester phosphodiesterase family protein [Deinococcus aetherius]BDP43613.1 putative glycerophosphoryl diester phosphodiesterase precursor [Deinococcus aetherius]
MNIRSAGLLLGGLITLASCGTPGAAPTGPAARAFDLQAHRGGLGLVSESTLASFGNALELGVTTLELDTQVTRDGKVVVTHDRKVSGAKCRDTSPATPGDPDFPYVGKFITNLTLAQVKTLDCGSQRLADFPFQRLVPGITMPELRDVFRLVRAYRADDVILNIETKVEAGAPSETAPRETFVRTVLREIRDAGIGRQVTVQSFDWGALMLVRQLEPDLPIVALTNGQQFLQAGQEGKSPWLGGLDIDDFPGQTLQAKYVAAARSFGTNVLSPVHGDPQNGRFGAPGYVPFTTPELVRDAHAAGMRVVPWTVDDRGTYDALIDAGVDGIITDYLDQLRRTLAERGFALPTPRHLDPAALCRLIKEDPANSRVSCQS